MNDKQVRQRPPFLGDLKQGIWLLGLSSCVLGIIDRSIASFSDGHVSIRDLMQLLTVSFFFVSWLFLKPKQQLKTSDGD